MRRIVANKILLITTLALFIFASFSVVIINYLNLQMMGESLIKIHNVYANSLEEASSEETFMQKVTAVPESVRVTVATGFGMVIADNLQNPTELENLANDPSFIGAKKGEPRISISKSKSLNSEVLSYATKIYNPHVTSEFMIVRTLISLNYNSTYFIMMLPLILGVLLLVLIMTYIFTNGLIKGAMMPIVLVQKSIENINKGEFMPIQVGSKYKDMQYIIDEINIFSSKLANSVNYLTYEQQKSNFILDNMSQGIIALSGNNNVALTNKAMLNMLNSSKNLLGCKLSNLVLDADLLNKLQEAVKSHKNSLFMYVLDDKVYKIEVVKIVDTWFNDDMHTSNLITFSDITSESKSSQIRSEFFANASHELKTPLTAIKGFSELLMANTKGSSQFKCAEEITKNSNRMLGLIDDMLKLSKLDANVDEESMEIIDLRKITDAVLSNLSAIAINRNVGLKASGEGEMFGSPKRIEEVITNLVDNAIKYNVDGGKVTVTIGTIKNNIYLTVEDTGIGIDAQHQSRIFERFYKVDKGRNRKVQSTGLGLAIVKHIILQHSGTIELESAINKGTKITVKFPTIDSIQ